MSSSWAFLEGVSLKLLRTILGISTLEKLKAESALPVIPLEKLLAFLRFDVERYDFKKSDIFWKAAMKGEFEIMKALSDDPTVGLNLQQRFNGSHASTALDWAILQNNREMVEWLCDKGAWSFRFSIDDFQEKFPDLKQKFNGRRTFGYFRAARQNELENIIETRDTGRGAASVNLIWAQTTHLDLAYIHKNETMAEHLFCLGARLCSITPEEFRKQFPELALIFKSRLQELYQVFQTKYPKIFKFTMRGQYQDSLQKVYLYSPEGDNHLQEINSDLQAIISYYFTPGPAIFDWN